MHWSISARIRAKFPIDEAWGHVWTGRIPCWSCERETRILSSVHVEIDRLVPLIYRCSARFSLAELGEFGGLFESIRGPIGSIAATCRVARRYSRARGRSVLSNGCEHCGAFIGEHLDLDSWADKWIGDPFRIELDARWRRALIEPGDARERARAVLR